MSTAKKIPPSLWLIIAILGIPSILGVLVAAAEMADKDCAAKALSSGGHRVTVRQCP